MAALFKGVALNGREGFYDGIRVNFIYLFITIYGTKKQRKPMDVMQKSQGPHIRA